MQQQTFKKRLIVALPIGGVFIVIFLIAYTIYSTDYIPFCNEEFLSELDLQEEDDQLNPQRQSLTTLEVEGVQLRADSHFLIATESGRGETVVPVPQPDYGVVEEIHTTESGEVFVLGEQVSYRLRVFNSGTKKEFQLSNPLELPVLYSKTCGIIGRVTRSCAQEVAVYNDELKAILIDGHSISGKYKSFILGRAEGDCQTSAEKSLSR